MYIEYSPSLSPLTMPATSIYIELSDGLFMEVSDCVFEWE
jgi:hypothetical protein